MDIQPEQITELIKAVNSVQESIDDLGFWMVVMIAIHAFTR